METKTYVITDELLLCEHNCDWRIKSPCEHDENKTFAEIVALSEKRETGYVLSESGDYILDQNRYIVAIETKFFYTPY